MSEGAQSWEDSWETDPSMARSPIWGDSATQFRPPQPARDQSLPLPPVPTPELLQVDGDWRAQNERRLDLASRSLAQNDELLDLLYTNVQRVRFNRYNLAVFSSIASLCRQNLLMLEGLGQIADSLKKTQAAAEKSEPAKALESLDHALDTAEDIRYRRNLALQNATATWYQSWFPRVAEANGRKYLHQMDDVKDHRPARTVDMSYLVYRELLYPLGDWAAKVVAVRNQYAVAHNLPPRDFALHWKETADGATGRE